MSISHITHHTSTRSHIQRSIVDNLTLDTDTCTF